MSRKISKEDICIKCGNFSFFLKYRVLLTTGHRLSCVGDTLEVLEKKCIRCGYRWYVPTKDRDTDFTEEEKRDFGV